MRAEEAGGPQDGTRRLAVLGSPIAHSKSPALHAAAYRELGLPWRYEAIEATEASLPRFIAGCDATWRGLSLTMPLKHAVMPLLSTIDDDARLTGGANTVLFDADAGNRVLRGFNTDVAGIVRALADAKIQRVDRVDVWGAGATAASALTAAARMGAAEAAVRLRSPGKGEWLRGLSSALGIRLTLTALDARPEHAPDLVLCTLPGPADPHLRYPAEMVEGTLLFDVAYDPWPTGRAARWEAAGGRACSGLGMLLHQALIQVRVFVAGDPRAPLPREDAVLAAMRDALAGTPAVPES